MSAELERLKSKRKGHRGVVSRLINEATPILEGDSNEKVANHLKTISLKLKEKLQLLQRFDESLMALIDMKGTEEDTDLINDKIEQVQSEIEIFLSKLVDKTSRIAMPTAIQPPEDVPTEHVNHPTTPIIDSKAVSHSTPVRSSETLTSSVLSKDSSVRVTGAKPKLPKLHLPKFTGDITRFKTFWDSFNSAIHMNTELSSIDKFNYVKALLDGPAANVVQGLSLTEDNYLAAVELVKGIMHQY